MMGRSRARAMVAYIGEAPATAHDLAEAFQVSDKTVYGVLSCLKRQGEVERFGAIRYGQRGPLCGIWKLTEKGKHGNL